MLLFCVHNQHVSGSLWVSLEAQMSALSLQEAKEYPGHYGAT